MENQNTQTVQDIEQDQTRTVVNPFDRGQPFLDEENNADIVGGDESQCEPSYLEGVIEALLFVNERPITLDQMKKVLRGFSGADIKKAIECLNAHYEGREGGMTVKEIAGGYQMLSSSRYASYIREFYKTKHKEKLSKPALETLAIIAYKEPVTRADIELIRGVNCDGVTAHLVNKELIKIVGRKDIPGRPFLYGTTKQFLEYFGLKSLQDLPRLEEFPALLENRKNDLMEEDVLLSKSESAESSQRDKIDAFSCEDDPERSVEELPVSSEENPVTRKAEQFLKEAESESGDEDTTK